MRVNYAGWPDPDGDVSAPDIPEGMASPNWNGSEWIEKEPSDIDRAIAAANARQSRVLEVSMRQCRELLIRMGEVAPGVLGIDAIDAYFEALEGIEGLVAKNYWQKSGVVSRDHPMVAAMAARFGWSEAQVDEMFATAAGL